MPVTMSDETRKQFTVTYLERIDSLPPGRRDEYHSLVMAAIDETGGDPMQALDIADRMMGSNPAPNQIEQSSKTTEEE